MLYFYPKDDTPGCTKEACSFRDLSADFAEKGAVILGVSPDDTESHVKFRDKFSLPFPLLSDPGAEVAQRFGIWVEKNRDGTQVHGRRADHDRHRQGWERQEAVPKRRS